MGESDTLECLAIHAAGPNKAGKGEKCIASKLVRVRNEDEASKFTLVVGRVHYSDAVVHSVVPNEGKPLAVQRFVFSCAKDGKENKIVIQVTETEKNAKTVESFFGIEASDPIPRSYCNEEGSAGQASGKKRHKADQKGQSSSMMNALEGSQDGSEYSHDECHDESHEDRQQVASPHRRIDSSQESAISKHSKVTSEHNDVEEDEELQETGEDEREAAISTRLGWTVKDLEQGLTAMKQAIPFFPVLKAEKHDPESSADVIEAFEAHYGEICASVRCLLEKDINHVLGEIVSVLNKLDHATMQKRLESACAQLFTTRLPSFRELLSLSVLNKIDPNSGCFGKAFKANLERKLLDLVLTLAPEVYRDQLQYLLQTPIQSTINYMYKHNIALSFVKKPLPGFAIRRRLFGSGDEPLLPGQAPIQTGSSFLEQLWALSLPDAAETIRKPGLIHFHLVTDSNCKTLPLLDVGTGTYEYVEDAKSEFFRMRNARTRIEWLSLYFFIMLLHLAKVSPQGLPVGADNETLVGRSRVAIHAMRTYADKFTYEDIIKNVLMKRTTPLAQLLVQDDIIWKAFQQSKSKRPDSSVDRLARLIDVSLVHASSVVMKTSRNVCMSVKNLFDPAFKVPGKTTTVSLSSGEQWWPDPDKLLD